MQTSSGIDFTITGRTAKIDSADVAGICYGSTVAYRVSLNDVTFYLKSLATIAKECVSNIDYTLPDASRTDLNFENHR